MVAMVRDCKGSQLQIANIAEIAASSWLLASSS